jgi:hypothetical protein
MFSIKDTQQHQLARALRDGMVQIAQWAVPRRVAPARVRTVVHASLARRVRPTIVLALPAGPEQTVIELKKKDKIVFQPNVFLKL